MVQWAVVLLLIVPSAFGQGQTNSERRKDPWLWTPEERIRERFSAESKAIRLELARPATRKAPPNLSPIDGDTHAGLFFPWELMDRLLRMQTALPSTINAVREIYREDIESAGWDYERFFSELDLSAAEYLVLFAQMNTERAATRGQAQQGVDKLAIDLCAARAAAMTHMRQTFGRVAFDRFLYTALARGFQSWTTDKRDAATLIRIEGGCKS